MENKRRKLNVKKVNMADSFSLNNAKFQPMINGKCKLIPIKNENDSSILIQLSGGGLKSVWDPVAFGGLSLKSELFWPWVRWVRAASQEPSGAHTFLFLLIINDY